MSKKKNTPVHRIKHGRIEAAIWENAGKNGAFYSVTFKRSYQTADGAYKDSHAYTQNDLFDLVRCAMDAQIWIAAPAQTASESASEAASEAPRARKKAS